MIKYLAKRKGEIMSTITFICGEERKEQLSKGIWSILFQHYFTTVYPNSRVDYENEGKEVYTSRLDDLMKTELCKFQDTEEGLFVEFDST